MDIHELVKNGNIKGFREALKKNKRLIHVLDKERGWSPLHYAAHHSRVKIIQILFENGANSNISDKTKKLYPMDVADGGRRGKVIQLLKGANGTFYETTMHNAAESGDVDTLEELLEEDTEHPKSRINERDKRGWMPLHYAVEQDDIEIVEMLLEYKANVNGATADGVHNPMEIAKDHDNKDMQKLLASKGGYSNRYRTQLEKPKVPVATTRKVGSDKEEEYDPNAMFVKTEKKGFFSKIGGAITGENKRQQKEKERTASLKKAKDTEEARKKIKAEEDRLKRARVIKWKWGEDPFKCKAETITYDSPCESYTFFMDIVGYSKKSTSMQKKVMDDLIAIVKGTQSYQQAQRQGKLIILPTGDGMALVFFNSVHAAFKCAIDTGKKCYKSKDIGLRMGINTGPVVPVKDINDNPNVSGDGINIAQRVMDAGDNDHILISNGVYLHVSEMDIPSLKFEDWGAVFVKHGSTVHLHTAYGNGFGRTEFPDWRGTKKAEFK